MRLQIIKSNPSSWFFPGLCISLLAACAAAPRVIAPGEASLSTAQMSSPASGSVSQQGSEGRRPNPTDSSSAANISPHRDEDLAGFYVSEITSNDPIASREIVGRFETILLYLDRDGNRITLLDTDDNAKIDALLKGDQIYFDVLAGGGKSSPRVSGHWTVKSEDGRLEGTWKDGESGLGGNWILRKLDNNRVELYTIESGPDRPFGIRESETLFDRVFSSAKNRNVVFYIHGRNQFFDEEFDSSMIPYTEASSDTRFVLIHWISWSEANLRPYRQARNAAKGLADVLFALDDYRRRKPGYAGDRNITLLAFSMGSIPLKVFVEELYAERALQEGLFDALILSSADVPIAGHRKWVEKIDFANDIYIIQNRRDLVLSLSEIVDDETPGGQSPRLGKGFGDETYTHFEDLAGNAKYLDVTRSASLGHRPFNLSSYPEDANATRLFDLLLNGEGFDAPDPASGLYRLPELSPVYYFSSATGPGDEARTRSADERIEAMTAYIESRASELYSERDRRPDYVKQHTSEDVFRRTGDWRPARGEWRTSWLSTNARLKIIDDTRVTYDYRNGRILFYSIDAHGRWEGYWVEDSGGRGCGKELKDGSSYWGRASFRFNDDYTRFEGSWDYCGAGKKTRWEGNR